MHSSSSPDSFGCMRSVAPLSISQASNTLSVRARSGRTGPSEQSGRTIAGRRVNRFPLLITNPGVLHAPWCMFVTGAGPTCGHTFRLELPAYICEAQPGDVLFWCRYPLPSAQRLFPRPAHSSNL